MDDSDKSCEKVDLPSEEIKKMKYNVAENAVEVLLEGVLTGKTVVLPSEVFRSVSTRGESSSINLSRDNARKPKAKTSAAEKSSDAACGGDPKKLTDDNYLATLLGTTDNNDVVFINNETSMENGDASHENDEDGRSTRPVTPTGLFKSARPVSEQYIQAKRILNSNPYGVEPPDFKNLPNELEEAFTLSAAYLAQLIISSTSHLNYKLDEVLKKVPTESHATACKPSDVIQNSAATSQISSEITESVAAKETKVQNSSPKEKSNSPKVPPIEKNSPMKPLHNSTSENCPPAPKPAIIDPFANFQIYLERIKMPPAEVTAHLNHVRVVTNKEATKYMAKFGFTPKKKK